MKRTRIKRSGEFPMRMDDISEMNLSRSMIAVRMKDELIIFNFDHSSHAIGEIYWRLPSESKDRKIYFSGTGRYLLETSLKADFIKVIDLKERKIHYQHSSSAKINAAVLLSTGQGEYLISTPAPSQLSITDLSTLEAIFTLDAEFSVPYNYVQLQVMHDNDTIAGMGFIPGESLDSLFAFSFSRSINEKKGLHFIRELSDYAPVLKIGESNSSTLFVYRDPEDSETEIEPDEEETKPLYNFRGFYEKSLHDHIIQSRIPVEFDFTGIRKFFMTDTTIVLCMDQGIKIISGKEINAEGAWFPTTKYSNIVDRSIIIMTGQGDLELISFD